MVSLNWTVTWPQPEAKQNTVFTKGEKSTVTLCNSIMNVKYEQKKEMMDDTSDLSALFSI